MKCVKIIPTILSGTIKIPPSKSMSHRAIIAAGLSSGQSRIDNVIFSDDIMATLDGLKSFGIEVQWVQNLNGSHRNQLTINGPDKLKCISDIVECKESGSTLRFLIPFAGLINEKITFKGKGKLVDRPLTSYYEIFDKQAIAYSNDDGKLPLSVHGTLKPGVFELRGDISSQFITGLLFALPLLNGDSEIVINTALESKGYVDLTLAILDDFSVKVKNDAYKSFYIKGNQTYKARDYRVEGDFSQAAFWIVAGLLGSNIKCTDLDISSMQGDKAILDIVREMGGSVKSSCEWIDIDPSKTKGMIIDASQCPDIVPILAVLGALSTGTTEIINAKRLRIKESDRLKAIATELNKLGADVREKEDGLIIYGKEFLNGGTVDSWNDHRIAMALAVASIKCKDALIITGSDSVNKSYPTFWRDFESLGGNIHECNLGT